MFFTEQEPTEIKVEHEETLQEKCEKMYGMGSDYPLSEEECRYEYLAQKIVEMEDHEVIEEINKSKNENGAYEDWIESLKDRVNELVFYFTRKDGGYIEQIKDYLNIDFEKFDDNNIRNKREKIKIIYFFYILKNKYFSNKDEGKNVVHLLHEVSMENIDTSFLNEQTYNGEITKHIKEELSKEISDYELLKIEDSFNIYLFFYYFMFDKQVAVDTCSAFGYEYDLSSLIHLIKTNKLPDCMFGKPYTLSPVEMLYFRIRQYEQQGLIKDIIFMNSIDINSNYSVPPYMIDEMKKLAGTKITIKEIDDYIRDPKKIAQFIFLKKDVSQAEIKKIKTHKKKIKKVVEFFYRTNFLNNVDKVLNKLHVISIFQAILLDEQNETLDYKFYRYRKFMKHMPSVQGALKNGNTPVDVLKAYWNRKVNDHWYANIGKYENRCKVRELENACDNVLMQLPECSNPSEYIEIYHFYINLLQEEVLKLSEGFKEYIDKLTIYLGSMPQNKNVSYSILRKFLSSEHLNFSEIETPFTVW